MKLISIAKQDGKDCLQVKAEKPSSVFRPKCTTPKRGSRAETQHLCYKHFKQPKLHKNFKCILHQPKPQNTVHINHSRMTKL